MNEAYSTREGGDIFSADMIQVEEHSQIAEMFEETTIFITGSTGYLGKMFLEKLLRCCPKVKMIYLLLRPKKGKDVDKRFEEIFDGPNMVPLKLTNTKYLEKVAMINGDCSLPNLGISDQDIQKIKEEVNFVIHCAATVRFDEKLKIATNINVRAVRDLIAIAKQMKRLKGYLHVSTAFCNCHMSTIEEKFYEPLMPGDNLIQLVEMLDDDKLDRITPGLLGNTPNSYVFTKQISEDMVKNNAKSLPIAIIRPSIVIGSLKEPVAGWIDNFYGATGVFIGAAIGLLRSLHGDRKNMAEMIPADFSINTGIAALWDTTCKKSLNDNVESESTKPTDEVEDDIPIYNVVSSPESPITWDLYTKLCEKHASQIPSEFQVWHYFFAMRKNYWHHIIAVFFLHTVPAYVVDFLCYCIGKKPMMVRGYQKINKFMDVLGYFALNQWTFKNDNVQNLWKKLSKDDKNLFQFSMANFDWDEYFYYYSRGARVYLLKDPLDTIAKGRIKHYKLLIGHYALMAVIFFLFYQFTCFFWRCIF